MFEEPKYTSSALALGAGCLGLFYTLHAAASLWLLASFPQFLPLIDGLIFGVSTALCLIIFGPWIDLLNPMPPMRRVILLCASGISGLLTVGYATYLLQSEWANTAVFRFSSLFFAWFTLLISLYILSFWAQKRLHSLATPALLLLMPLFVGTALVLTGLEALGVAELYCLLLPCLAWAAATFIGRQRKYSTCSYLRVLNGAAAGAVIFLEGQETSIGSGSGDTIYLPNYNELSISHARVIRQFGSAFYTVINNDPKFRSWCNFRYFKEQALKNGDILKLGQFKAQFVSVHQ